MSVLALDTAGTLELTVAAAVAYLAMLWIALAFFVVRDARRRTGSILFTAFAGVLGLFPPFLGALVYLMVRPPSTLDEQRAAAMEEWVLRDSPESEVQTRPCPGCGKDIEIEFVLCPYCRTQFSRRCHGCGRALRLGWPVCPYCAEEVGTHALPSRVGRATSS
jgi:hypothetical protein